MPRRSSGASARSPAVACIPLADRATGCYKRQVGSRWTVPEIATPALVVDLEACARNISAMASHAAANGIELRPHAKTHKCPAIATRQLAAGATGITVATLGEAEVFAEHGVGDVFVAYPLWAVGDIGQRLAQLSERVRLSVGADSVAAVEVLRRELDRVTGRSPGQAARLAVRVEVDCGLRRSGVAPADAVHIARAAADAGLVVDGIFTFPGHSYAPGMAATARDDEARALCDGAASLEAGGIPCRVRSGGSTPTAAGTAGDAVNELRPGVYVFNDAQQLALGTCQPDAVALAAIATVVSAPAPGRIVLDAGAKVLGPERPPWAPGHGVLPDRPAARVTGLWEHHAVVDVTGTAKLDLAPLRLGAQVAVVPNHVCTAVNLARVLHVVAGGELVDRWEVAAAGANR